MFSIAVLGDTLAEASAAVGRLAGCSLPHALQLPAQAALQPEGWLAERWRCYHDVAGDVLWVAVAAGTVPGGDGSALLSQEACRDQEAAATRALLAAFLTSHAVIWLQPPQTPAAAQHQLLPGATALLARLRLLQQLKGALLPALPALLGVATSQASASLPGLCIPQLLVAAQVPPAAAAASMGPTEVEGRLQAAQAAAERQLRLLLKRCRVLLPPDNARALCTLPADGPLVLRLSEHLGCGGSQEQLVAAALAELTLPFPPHQQQQQQQGRVQPAAAVAAALAAHRAAVAGMAQGAAAAQLDVASWRRAVASHAAVLEAAARKAAPSTSTTSEAADAAAGDVAPADVAVPPEAAAAAAWLEACSDGVRQFSLASCKRAAAVASDAYRRNTPALLPAAGHAAALAAALRLYRSLARGPAAAAGEAALRQQLTEYWTQGHQQCEAVSFLGNPCCLPAHDPEQQPHTSSGRAGERPLLLLATGSGTQQQRIPEPFTVAELQQAAAAVAAESVSAAARAQFYVRRMGDVGAAGVGASAPRGVAGMAVVGLGDVADSAAAGAAGREEEEEAEEEEAAGRGHLSGSGHSSDDNIGAATAALTPLATPAGGVARGMPAAGCWLELHVLGPRNMWKTAALAAALLLDGQPGWLRAGGCMLATLPLLVRVPGKAGEQLPGAAAGQQQQDPGEDFPSLAEMKQQEQRRRRPTAARKPVQQKLKSKEAAQVEEQQQPRLLNWPGWQPPAERAGASEAERAPLFAALGAAGSKQQVRGGRQQQQRGGKRQVQQAGTVQPAAAAVAGAELASLLLGAEYESVSGQRLLLTPALLAAAVQSSLDAVSVRQHAPAAAAAASMAVGPGPRTAAAAAAAAQVQPGGAAAALLQQDLPLWMQLPGEQLAQMSAKRRSVPGSSADANRPALVWLQLRRLLVGTPEVAVPLEVAPQLLLEVPAEMLSPAGPAAAAAAASGAGGLKQPAAPATAQLRYSLAASLALPPASFCVLALPWLLTAPMAQPGGSGANAGSAALIRCSGPLRAVLVAQTAVRPATAAQGSG